MASSHASRVLERLGAAGQVVRLKRGVWAFPDRLEPLQVPEQLTAIFQAKKSLLSTF